MMLEAAGRRADRLGSSPHAPNILHFHGGNKPLAQFFIVFNRKVSAVFSWFLVRFFTKQTKVNAMLGIILGAQ